MTQTLKGLNQHEAFTIALKEMPETFSSQVFGKYCRENGYTAFAKGGDVIGKFLRSHKKHILQISRSTWQKKYATSKYDAINHELDALPYITKGFVQDIPKEESPVKTVQSFLEQLPVESVIKFITSKGYVILKP
jgi:hypothetical protein